LHDNADSFRVSAGKGRTQGGSGHGVLARLGGEGYTVLPFYNPLETRFMAASVETRADYGHFLKIPTRWRDNDVYQHVNNVVYYSFFDTVINEYLIREGGLDFEAGSVVGLAIETQCSFHKPIQFPQAVDAGLRVGKLGNSSVRYEVGLFIEDDEDCAASGYFVHVFVQRSGNRPTPIPPKLRACMERLLTDNLGENA
jgi:acyl-CoA thioester hydrolase